MKTKNLLLFLLLVIAAVSNAFGQAATSSTTFSIAPATTDTTVYVTSATGMSSAGASNQFNTVLYVDREAMGVISVSGTALNVIRGLDGTRTTTHATTATVWFGPPGYFSQNAYEPSGSCTPSQVPALPRFYEMFGTGWTCPSVGPRANLWTLQVPNQGETLPTDNTQAGVSAQSVCHARYSFAVDGGAVSTITPATGCTIPVNAVIYRVLVSCNTTTVGSTGNISVGLSAGGAGAAALWAATARASCSTGTFFDGVPVAGPTASLANATYIRMSAAGNITFTISTNALTAGIVDIEVWYTNLVA